ncbi:hypothetical protein ACFQ0B_22320 [Nonomuraea thailandensis]
MPPGHVGGRLVGSAEGVAELVVDVPERAEEPADQGIAERPVEDVVEEAVGLGETSPAWASPSIRAMTSATGVRSTSGPSSISRWTRPLSRISRISTRWARWLAPFWRVMRLWKVSSSTSPARDMRPTNMPKPWRISTMPTACRAFSASRTELRLTRSSSMSSDSVGRSRPPPARV